MPSIEIVCVGQTQVTDFSDLPFRLFAEDRLVSHRSPHPLFQSDFDALQGCIYHLCNPVQGYTAYHLLAPSDADRSDRDWWMGVSFLPAYAPSVRAIMAELLKASPVGKVVFTSDYQFGPTQVRRYKRPLTLERFWELHDAKKLHMNALYPLHRLERSSR